MGQNTEREREKKVRKTGLKRDVCVGLAKGQLDLSADLLSTQGQCLGPAHAWRYSGKHLFVIKL